VPVAWAASTLAAGLLHFPAGYSVAGQTTIAMRNVRWALEYLVKAHVSASSTGRSNVVVAQVGARAHTWLMTGIGGGWFAAWAALDAGGRGHGLLVACLGLGVPALRQRINVAVKQGLLPPSPTPLLPTPPHHLTTSPFNIHIPVCPPPPGG
jgi:hypothetical protein